MAAFAVYVSSVTMCCWLPASAVLTGEYGEAGLFAGVPCVIGASGVEEVVELPLTDEEKATFHACCEGIRHNMEHLKEI